MNNTLVRTGVLGGTFNPVHNGHIAIAETARATVNLDEVIFMPAGQPLLKDDNAIIPAEHRVRMVLTAVEDNPYFKLSTIEIERVGPSYTVDTLTELQSQLGPGHEIFFILGWDSLVKIPHWKEPEHIIQMCKLVAVPRPGWSLPETEALERAIPGIQERLIILDKPEMDISSSDIRKRLVRGLDVSHLLPGPVEKYIRENGLYTTA